jgi:hypothetical protein
MNEFLSFSAVHSTSFVVLTTSRELKNIFSLIPRWSGSFFTVRSGAQFAETALYAATTDALHIPRVSVLEITTGAQVRCDKSETPNGYRR